MRHLARRLAQRPASDYGRHTAAPNVLKSGHSKQTFTHFNILLTEYDTKRRIQGQAMRLSVCYPAIWWGQYTAIANAMKTAHFNKTLIDFSILPTRCDTKNLHWRLRQGQATRLSARRPAQRLASDWGRHTTAPNALKTGRCKQKFTDFNVLSIQYGTEKKDRHLRQGQAMRLSVCRPAQRLVMHWGGTLPPPMH